eukprot:8956675-Prorocentrum_lima.AAC.1
MSCILQAKKAKRTEAMTCYFTGLAPSLSQVSRHQQSSSSLKARLLCTSLLFSSNYLAQAS